jgi:hypothetical protein
MLLAVHARGKDVPLSVAYLGLAAAIAAGLTFPYTEPYLNNARMLGERPAHEIRMYSASLWSYVTWPEQNWWWSWTSARFTGNELHLAPGIVLSLLALVGVAGRPRRLVWVYGVLGLLALDVSLGVNGFIYPWLMEHVDSMRSLRAPARFSILTFAAMSVLVALGVDALQRRLRSSSARNWLAAGAVILIAVESASAPAVLMKIPTATPDVYRYVMNQGRSVLVELPMPHPSAMPAFDPYYEYFSRAHWFPLVNGYSGYHPPEYVNTLTDMLRFPDDQSIARLRQLDVRFVIVHTHLYEREEFVDLMLSIAKHPELVPHGRYRDWAGEAEVFELMPESK